MVKRKKNAIYSCYRTLERRIKIRTIFFSSVFYDTACFDIHAVIKILFIKMARWLATLFLKRYDS